MNRLFEHPITLLAMGGSSGGLGIWALTAKVIGIGTLLFGFISALCGAVLGVFGVYVLWVKFKKGTLFNDDSND